MTTARPSRSREGGGLSRRPPDPAGRSRRRGPGDPAGGCHRRTRRSTDPAGTARRDAGDPGRRTTWAMRRPSADPAGRSRRQRPGDPCGAVHPGSRARAVDEQDRRRSRHLRGDRASRRGRQDQPRWRQGLGQASARAAAPCRTTPRTARCRRGEMVAVSVVTVVNLAVVPAIRHGSSRKPRSDRPRGRAEGVTRRDDAREAHVVARPSACPRAAGASASGVPG